MTLSKYKAKPRRAIHQFVNRDDNLRLLRENCNKLILNKDFFRVVNIYGFGGIGKTRLLNHFLSENKSLKSIEFIHFSLEIFRNDAITDVLILLRKTIKEKCVLFDYALMKYWCQTKPHKLDDDFLNFIHESIFIDVLDSTASLAGLNVSGIVRLINKQKDKMASKFFKNLKNQIIDIDSLSDTSLEGLYNRLPFYLGLDLERIVKNTNKNYCFIVDSFKQPIGFSSENDWLMEFIASAHTGMFIITSREKLDWVERNSEWGAYMDQTLLKELSEMDSEKFLRNHIQNDENALINTMIRSSQGIPLYLDLCVDVYNKKNATTTKIFKDDFVFTSEQEIVVKFLNHLSLNDQEILKILSIVGLFNESIYGYLIKDLNLQSNILEYERLCNNTLLDYLHSETNLLKVHDVIQININKILEKSLINKVLKSYFHYLSYKGLYEHSNRQLISILRNGVEIIERQDENDCSVQNIESLLDIFLFLYDNGWWIEIRRSLNSLAVCNTKLKVVLKFSESLYFRRTKSIESGIEILEEVIPFIKVLGKHKHTLQSELSYMYSLTGQYDKAHESFKRLYDSLTMRESVNERYYKKTVTQYADILMLKGSFKKSMRILTEFNNHYISGDIDLIESIRLIGHNFRFNFFLDQAEFKYKSAIEHSSNSLLVKGKLMTNLCETSCYFSPDETLKLFNSALEINKNIDSQLEIGKLFCAKGIALISFQEFELSKKSFQKAWKIYKKMGYVSGELFTLLGYLFLLYAKNGCVDKKIKALIYKRIKIIKVYQHLLLPIFLLENDVQNEKECRTSFDWIDFEYTKNQYYEYFKKITKRKV